ncbi:hypothetical protein AOC36_00100 [Erysipelothrix larvae]|uniref:PTS EIIB type-1 domain-containing protein n=1 Tax=Erysipelothrix larvae TaxID=1514105 RepID=A0A109UGD6_9FIRM|nr:PTS transporter subunit EIIB [Erysipelothrix larvae]AMC92448.1 hypothetical protein AOC36_00100 [Erysipelothrix larvae]
MNRFQTYYENLNLPLKLALFGALLVGVGSLLGNPFIHEVLKLDTTNITQVTQTLLVCGSLILTYFPITIFVKLLQLRTDDKNMTIIGVASYAIFLMAILLFAPQNLSSNSYVPNISYTVGTTSTKLMRTGVFGLIGVYFIVRWVYKRNFGAKLFNVLAIFDASLFRFIYCAILSFVFGLLMANYWPVFIDWIYGILRFIASDVYNPMTLFAFGTLERFTSLLGLNDIVRAEMWLGSLGGTWNDLNNVTLVGDINIWQGQLNSNLAILGIGGAGRYSTAFYVLNLFAIPGYITAVFTSVSDRKRRTRLIGVAVFLFVLSMLSGILDQVELFMLLTSPLLYLFHIFMVGFVNAVLTGFSVTIGFSFLNVLGAANPGNLIDLIGLARNNVSTDQIWILVLFGAIVFFIYFGVTRFYYSKLAMDVLNVGSKDDDTTDFIERLGGIDNITEISSMPTRLIVTLKDDDDINVEGLHHQGVSRIVKARIGYILSYGAGAYMLQKEVNKRMKEKDVSQSEES